MLKMKIMKPITWRSDEPIRFECQDSDCGDIVLSSRIWKHATQVHYTDEVEIDSSMGNWVAPEDADPVLKAAFGKPETKITHSDD